MVWPSIWMHVEVRSRPGKVGRHQKEKTTRRTQPRRSPIRDWLSLRDTSFRTAFKLVWQFISIIELGNHSLRQRNCYFQLVLRRDYFQLTCSCSSKRNITWTRFGNSLERWGLLCHFWLLGSNFEIHTSGGIPMDRCCCGCRSGRVMRNHFRRLTGG